MDEGDEARDQLRLLVRTDRGSGIQQIFGHPHLVGVRQRRRLHPLQFELRNRLAGFSKLPLIKCGVGGLAMALVFEELKGMSQAPAQANCAA